MNRIDAGYERGQHPIDDGIVDGFEQAVDDCRVISSVRKGPDKQLNETDRANGHAPEVGDG